jgi:MoxR-like ATPase
MSTTEEIYDSIPAKVQEIRSQIALKVVGQKSVVDQMLIALFSNGHCLFVGVPGLAKTLMVNSLAESLGLEFNRIQFTPDLMPGDIVGSEILQEEPDTGRRALQFVKGPVFTNLLLADEINRTPPKTQSALLEAMQEKQVTILGNTHQLPRPFLVFATQNPVEQEGTYPLPEAALDRFMFSVLVQYPSQKEEIEIIKKVIGSVIHSIKSVLSSEDLLALQKVILEVPLSDVLLEKITRLVALTRSETSDAPDVVKKFVRYGAGTRASIYLSIAARTRAAMRGVETPSWDDVKAVAKPVLRHRVMVNFQAEAQGISSDQIIDELVALL